MSTIEVRALVNVCNEGMTPEYGHDMKHYTGNRYQAHAFLRDAYAYTCGNLRDNVHFLVLALVLLLTPLCALYRE